MASTVEFLDLRGLVREIEAECLEAAGRVLTSGHFVLGPELDAFERRFSDYCGVGSCLGVGNGLDAIIIALRALEIGRGDEVILPAHTFIATWLAVSAVGATLVPVDIDRNTFNIDPEAIAQAITSRTKAIIGVHLYGRVCDVDRLRALSRRHGLFFIEDAAQAQGAAWKGQRAGSLGDLAAFSFYPGKNLGAFGDAGAITTQNRAWAENASSLRNYGAVKKYHHHVKGLNSRLDELQAALLNVKLRHLESWNARRRAMARLYVDNIENEHVLLPSVPMDGMEHVWHLFVVRTRYRESLQQHLQEHGVQTLIHYPVPCHLSKAYHEMGLSQGSFPAAEEAAEQVLSLPMGPHLDASQARRVIEAVNAFKP